MFSFPSDILNAANVSGRLQKKRRKNNIEGNCNIEDICTISFASPDHHKFTWLFSLDVVAAPKFLFVGMWPHTQGCGIKYLI